MARLSAPSTWRAARSAVEAIIPIAKKNHVAAINWALINGRSQTNVSWDSWQRPYVTISPTVWFHDVFYEGGTPYRAREAKLIRLATSKQ